MQTLIAADAQKAGTPLNEKQIERLVNGIWWKNTIENYAQMGLNNDRPLQHVEDMITNITNVLVTTGAIPADPTGGSPNLLYYDKILTALRDNNFHPGGLEEIRQDSDVLPVLKDEEWAKLTPVGTLQVPTIVFARGTSGITEQSELTLNELIEKLKSWPQYYVSIHGNASLRGNLEANKLLAAERAKAVETYLLENGISKTRVKAVAVEPSGSTDVVFQLGYMPY
jgi:flagellar motor protein MotB